MRDLNTAIIGFGLSGSTFHAPIITNVPGFCLSHIVSSQANKVTDKYPNTEIISNINELFIIPKIELVVITTPNLDHYPLAKKALESGKHVILEKPFVLRTTHGEELIKIAQENNLFLSVYQNRRWDNGFLTLKKCLIEKIFGEIFNFEAYFDRFRPIVSNIKWREQAIEGSGILYDLGVHLIDQALELFGMPAEVFADLEMQREGSKAIDYFNLILKYDKIRVQLGSSSIITVPRPVLSIYGTKGSYIKNGFDPQENDLKSGKVPNSNKWGEEDEVFSPSITLLNYGVLSETKLKSIHGAYQNYYQSVYNSIVNGEENPVKPETALNNIKIIELAIESWREKKWVNLK
jgi:scyllo-inositol 2-dehydrogenase (NADP+)